jgi:pimeloyl-ACP methyl ester carboxylesterase
LRFWALTVLAISLLTPQIASAFELKPFKDDLFAYPGILESRDNGDFIVVDYRKPRDIYQRDSQPLVKVKPQYISTWVDFHQSFDTLDLGGRKLDIFSVGKIGKQRFSVIFLHGRGGSRLLGANDIRFGGNFNRLKNLAYDNGGVYVAPTIKAFDANGVADVAGLIRYLHQKSGGKPVILACASMGSIICDGIARDPKSVEILSGMILMSAVYDPNFMTTPLYAAHIPVLFAHSTLDVVYSYKDQVGLYDALKKKNYPARFVLFNTGKHGTPLRMLDWRVTLNWFLKNS